MKPDLEAEMNAIAQFASKLSADDEELPSLFLTLADGAKIVCVLSVGGGSEIARAARILVWENEPVMAVLQTEGWTVGWDLPLDDPDRLAVLRGDKAPSELPPGKRGEALILYGETADGQHAYRMFKIIPRTKKHRDIVAIQQDPGTEMDSRFHPLFVVEDLMREIASGEAMKSMPSVPDELHQLFREVANEMTPDEQRAIIRRVFGQVLASGGGANTLRFERASDRGHDMARLDQIAAQVQRRKANAPRRSEL